MIAKSIIYGVLLFVIIIALEWILKSEVHWQNILFGTILATIVFFVFQLQDKKSEWKSNSHASIGRFKGITKRPNLLLSGYLIDLMSNGGEYIVFSNQERHLVLFNGLGFNLFYDFNLCFWWRTCWLATDNL